jgi:hypothetical protein
LPCIALSHITAQADIKTGFLKDVVTQHGCCGLAVCTCNAHMLGIGIPACKFNFRDHGNIAGLCLDDDIRFIRYPGALDNFIRF